MAVVLAVWFHIPNMTKRNPISGDSNAGKWQQLPILVPNHWLSSALSLLANDVLGYASDYFISTYRMSSGNAFECMEIQRSVTWRTTLENATKEIQRNPLKNIQYRA